MNPGDSRTNRRRIGSPPARQRGIALLVAIMLVALGTIIATAIAYENAMTARRGAATYAFDESLLIAEGAEAFAAYGLREVHRSDPNYTYPAQGWGKPLGPIEVVPGVMLQASLEDLQGRFNLNTLVKSTDGTVDADSFAAFQRLLEMLGIDHKWAGYIVDWIDPGIDPMIPDGAEDSVYMGQSPPYRTPNMYITSVSELLALPGFGRKNYDLLAPYVTALPIEAQLNICTASGPVLDMFVGHPDFSTDPEGLAKNRASAGGCFPKLTDYQATFDGTQWNKLHDKFKQNSAYFRLTSYVTIGTAEFNLYSLLVQDPTGTVRPILRSYTPD